MKIRGVLFDLGNVLIDYRPEIFISRLEAHSKIPAYQLISYFLTANADAAYTEGKISSGEFFDRVARELDLECGAEIFRDFWCDIFSAKGEMEALVRAVKKKYPVWVLSNTNEWHFEFLRPRFPVLDSIDRFFLSYELKCQKPDPQIYQQVVKQTGFLPQEIFFTDDIQKNVDSARQAGFRSELFRSAEELAAQLTDFGIILNGEKL